MFQPGMKGFALCGKSRACSLLAAFLVGAGMALLPCGPAAAQPDKVGVEVVDKVPGWLPQSDAKIIDLVKNSMLNGYPKDEGFQTVGKSFEAFFGKPRWKVVEKSPRTAKVRFSGQAEQNGGKARFVAVFDIVSRGNGWSWTSKGYVNGNDLGDRAWSNLLGNVMTEAQE